MKNLLKFSIVFFFTLFISSCSEDENTIENSPITANIESINKIINGFDNTLKFSQKQNTTDYTILNDYFLQSLNESGLDVFESTTNISAKNSNNNTFSDEYNSFAAEIAEANTFITQNDYLSHLNQLKNNVLSSTITVEEKQQLIDKIAFMNAFVDWMGTLESQNTNKSSFLAKSDCDGWWDCWGRCAAGTIGGAGLGALGGAALGGGGCTVVLPVIGTVACGTVGAVVGGVSGVLAGAASSC